MCYNNLLIYQHIGLLCMRHNVLLFGCFGWFLYFVECISLIIDKKIFYNVRYVLSLFNCLE